MVICYIGDSLTLGCGDPSGMGWPGRISGKLNALGVDVTSYNLGVRKDATVKINERWQREVEPRLLPGVETKLVFHFGVADVMNKVPADETLAAAETILTQAKTLGEVLLVGPTPVINERKTEAVAELSARFESLCETLDVPFVPVLQALRESDLYRKALEDGDSVHPTVMGYAALTECILKSETARDFFGLE